MRFAFTTRRLAACLLFLAIAAGCGDKRGVLAPSKTYTVSPSSVVMRAGDSVVFRIVTSAPDPGYDGVYWDIVDPNGDAVVEICQTPGGRPREECAVTVRTVVRAGRIRLIAQQLELPGFYYLAEASIDVVP